jgi:hypothetical protein
MALKKGGFRTAAVEPRRHVGVAAAVAVGRCAALAEQRVKVAVHVAPRVAAGGVDGGEGGGGGDAPVTCGTRKTPFENNSLLVCPKPVLANERFWAFPFEFNVCLTRACLGKLIVFNRKANPSPKASVDKINCTVELGDLSAPWIEASALQEVRHLRNPVSVL